MENWYIVQQKETYVNDLSTITDLSSFIDFIRIAYQTNPLMVVAGFIIICIVSYFSFLYSRNFSRKYVKEYLLKRM